MPTSFFNLMGSLKPWTQALGKGVSIEGGEGRRESLVSLPKEICYNNPSIVTGHLIQTLELVGLSQLFSVSYRLTCAPLARMLRPAEVCEGC
jgi:hypothetical protein